ncbi:MAG: glycosyltransferase [Clostridia bacterium]|nr:glycosyltransferase [Clostridia bacterium]
MNNKIYITALHLMHGGIEMAISLLSNAFIKRGYDVTILCVYNLGEPAYFLDEKIKIEYLTSVHPNKEEIKAAIRSKNPVKMFKEALYGIKVLTLKQSCIKKAFSEINDGIVISTRNEHSVLLSKYGNKNVLKIAQLHHDHCFKKSLLNDIKNNYHNIDHFVLLTDTLTAESEELMSKGNNHHTNCVTIENFLESEVDVANINRTKTVVAVGRMHPVKAFDRLLKVWVEVSSKHPDWCLKLIGGGDELESLKALSKELGIESTVVFTGPLDHDKVIDEMKSASIFAMTSLSEGFPFVLIEALSCGLPAIAYDVRVGPRAIIKDNENGYLVKDGECLDFAKRLCTLIEDKDKLSAFSAKALVRANDFSEETILNKWMSIIN